MDIDHALFDFFVLGCDWAKLCSNNLLYFDFHKGNFISDGETIRLIDTDDTKIVPFPEELEKYANGLMNLYSNLGMEYGAAFRYGVINALGPSGRLIYDILYNSNKLTCLKIGKKQRQIETDITKRSSDYKKWVSSIGNSFINSVTHNACQYYYYSFIELMEKNDVEYHRFKEENKNNYDVLMHDYSIYFANGIKSGNDFDVAAAALTLSQIEQKKGHYIVAGYYLVLTQMIMVQNKELLITMKNDFIYGCQLYFSYLGEDTGKAVLDYISHETMRLRIERKLIYNYFYEVWYWEDYQFEYSIAEITAKQDYGCYLCLDCNNIGFFDDAFSGCEKCNSHNTKHITLEEYVHSLAMQVSSELGKEDISEGDQLQDKGAEELIGNIPTLDRITYIPIYVSFIEQCYHDGQYTAAIELAEKVDSYLASNPEVMDSNGYVLEEMGVGGKLFYNVYDPGKIIKLFRGSEQVRNDYESYICYILCMLYKEKDDIEKSIEYAGRLIDIANASTKWVFQSYIRFAYSVLESYYAYSSNPKEALYYANILFTYDTLDILESLAFEDKIEDELRESVSTLMNIGESNLKCSNSSLAFSCFLLALKIHIFLFGSRHPDSASIYANLGRVHAAKKMYNEAYAFWGIALSLLNNSGKRYEKMVADIENDVKACLSLSDYKGSYLDWKEQWINEKAFSVFPEKRYEQNEKESNRIDLLENEIHDRYVVFNGN